MKENDTELPAFTTSPPNVVHISYGRVARMNRWLREYDKEIARAYGIPAHMLKPKPQRDPR